MDGQLRRAVNATLMPGFPGPDLPGWLSAELADGLGAVCLFGSNIVAPGQVRGLTKAIHAANPDAVVATDEEGGDVTRLHHRDGSPAPSMAYLGHRDDLALTHSVAAGIGAELRAAGIDLNLAPVADVNANPRNPVIGVRSFGADADLVARHVAAYVEGLQSAGVGAVAKHFPGHGDTGTDSHLGLPAIAVDAATLGVRELPPFAAAVTARTVAVMTSHILVPALDPRRPATFSPAVLGELRSRGFTGAIVSDALDMAGASADRGIPEAAVLALAAGVDLLCLGSESTAELLDAVRRHILGAVAQRRLAPSRVLNAAGRVHTMSSELARLRGVAVDPPSEPVAVDPSGFLLRAPIEPVVAPVLLRLASPASIAAGETPWGVGDHLAGDLTARLPGATTLTVADLDALADVLRRYGQRPLIVQGRDLNRVEFLQTACATVLRQRPDALLVELGWPDHTGPVRLDVVTFGSSRGAAIGLIQLLAEGAR
ncbi:glycoside hydrolase family 3 N-terminal domain-containing protein [Micropruina sp.]|uniref:glycoside hydrolase family 3 N-terminal domain-containing protein n=1 Tax=Micropruina sp. TaxID=2737536 RepID=UPI00261E7436|nr:glycoside hydrolase family 3 N-terminal domain-containing protein [Micropruina sp.]